MPPFSRWFAVALVATFVVVSALAQNDPASRRAAIEAIYPLMVQALETQNYGRARNICEQAIAWEPQNPLHHYNLACIEAQVGGNRLPIALGELQLAVALGFDDAVHLQSDPDLSPLRSDPKFAEIIRNVAHNASAAAGQPAIVIPPAPVKPVVSESPDIDTDVELPAPPAFKAGVPVGLYLMSRYWPLTRTAELAAWYFAPDGRVYQNLRRSFSAADLTQHSAPRGTARAQERQLEIRWGDGQVTNSELERDGTGFIWDRGIFTAIGPFENAAEVAGTYEGDEAAGSDGERRPVSARLQLRADDSFSWTGASISVSGALETGSTLSTRGRWKLRGCSLVLTADNKSVLRRLA
ncbi:MAG: hypothetical protein ABIQ12_11840, partial [Opitutaceae bacterium]